MQHNIQGIIHASSASKQTVFMEPQEIVAINNRIQEIKQGIQKEIQRILTALSHELFLKCKELEETKKTLLVADAIFAKAELAHLISAQNPHFSKDQVDLKQLKNPTMLLQGEPVVPNDLNLESGRRVLLLSGPNAGGKTVLLKSLGLAAHMARCGLPICAQGGSKIVFFSEIFTAVGDTQSVNQKLSTFAGHLQVLHKACQGGPRSLILIDEICSSTDPEEGAALACGFIDHYVKKKSFALITSHLNPLKTGWQEDGCGVVKSSMGYDEKAGNTSYKLIPEIPGRSIAFATAKKIGILASVYERAQFYLSPLGQKQLQSMEKLENLQTDVLKLKKQLKNQIEKFQDEEQKYQILTKNFLKSKEEKLREEVEKILKKIKEDIEKNKIKESKKISDLSKIMPKIVKYTSDSNKDPSYPDLESFSRSCPRGSSVWISSIHREGIVQGESNDKGEIPLISGSMKIWVHWSLLKSTKSLDSFVEDEKQNSQISSEHLLTASPDSINLKMQNTNEALLLLEEKLNQCQGSIRRLQVFHGKGPLKKSIRNHLSRSPLILQWVAGPPGPEESTFIYLNPVGK